MPKAKQQRPKRKKELSSTHDKSKMKQVLQKLAQSKVKNQKIGQTPTSITQMHVKHKKICKQNKKNKRKDQDENQQIQNVIQAPKPIINIFAVDNYQAQKPVIINNPNNQNTNKMQDQADLQSRARRVMGQNFNLQKFGDKPLRIIQQNNQPLVMSEDEDQPNSIKTITHNNIKVPQGNRNIKRNKQIQDIRQKLPIFMKQQQIVQTVNAHLVTLICGQTGSGKSTQLPQFLTQKNYQKLGKIAITQPRRLATISLARRVAQQMNFKIGSQVAYQVRHQRKQSKQSFIKFMTDGILLKQMSSDSLLLDYSVIIIDQAHQRKLNTDILIGLLSRLILVRYKMSLQNKCNPLRLIIMSATLRIQDFQNIKLFNFYIPILKIQAKMFPVTIFHQKNTPQNYIQAAIKKCIKIHKQLPSGDVLIFLTGKQQIHQMSIKLQIQLNRIKIQQHQSMRDQQQQQNYNDQNQIKAQGQYFQPIRKNSSNNNHSHIITDFIIYKLYSSLPTQQQDKIFKLSHPGCRKFIISTNIAQTSITVPNIRYVIDSGQQKHRYFDDVWKWKKGWGSKAMAAQRSGRAGRTTHGYCYRLYSSALYANIMDQHPQPQICRLPLQSVVLEIKAIGFNNIFTFPFPTPPANTSLKKSLENLLEIGAVQGAIDIRYIKKQVQKQQKQQIKTNNTNKHNTNTNPNTNPQQLSLQQQQQQSSPSIPTVQVIDNCKITQLGKIISFIPLSPKLSKMLLLANKLHMQKYIVIITVLLTVQSIFKIKYNSHNYEFDNDKDNNNKGNKSKIIQQRRSQMLQFYKKYNKYIDKQCGSDLFISMNIVGYFLQQIHQVHTSNKQKYHNQNNNNNNNNNKNNNNNNTDTFIYPQSSIQSIQSIIISQSNKLQLNSNVMRQFYYNCDQICQIYQTLTNNKINFNQYYKPTSSQYTIILEILLSTYNNNICKYQQNNKYIDRYQQPVYIHRMSTLYKNKHLFIGCIDYYINQLNNRKYMRYPFKIQNYQLLSTFGKIKQTTQYLWNNQYQQIVCKANGQIYGWQIPNLIIKSIQLKGQGKYYAFGRMLLSGQIIYSFKILQQKKLLNSSINNIRPDCLQEKVQRYIMELKKYNITSKNRLIQCMKNNGHFLQKQLKLWINVNNYQKVYQTLRNAILNSVKEQK